MKKINYIISTLPVMVINGILITIGYVNDVVEMMQSWKAIALDIIKYFCIILLVYSLIVLYINNKRKDKKIEDLVSLEKDYNTLKSENEILLETAYNGIKYTKNKVVIEFDMDNKKYHFGFEKHYTITSDVTPEYYSAQFYANKFITDKDKAQNFYSNHKIQWKDLNVKACISYKRPTENHFSKWQNLTIININDNTNYIPFKIKYNLLGNGRKIRLTKDTEIKLKYCYSVPITYWGSYINRSVSYFGEKTTIEINYKNQCNLNVDVQKLASDGTPVELEESKYERNDTMESNNKKKIHIELKSERCSRYRITWNSKEYFGGTEENTAEGKDELGLTNR